jgi:type IV secretory pathway protease TraF
MVKKLISFDPEVKHPCATVFREGRWVSSERFMGFEYGWVCDVYNFLKREKPDLVVVEDQYLPVLEKKREILARAKSVFALVAARSYIEACCLLLGIKCERVNPLSWQVVIGGSRQGRLKCKKASMDFYREKLGMPMDDNNITDSFCIGWYWTHKETLNESSGVCADGEG